jgi:hypothetical protein
MLLIVHTHFEAYMILVLEYSIESLCVCHDNRKRLPFNRLLFPTLMNSDLLL